MPNKVIFGVAASRINIWKLHISIHINKPTAKVSYVMHSQANAGENRLHSSNLLFRIPSFALPRHLSVSNMLLVCERNPMRFSIIFSRFTIQSYLRVFAWLCPTLRKDIYKICTAAAIAHAHELWPIYLFRGVHLCMKISALGPSCGWKIQMIRRWWSIVKKRAQESEKKES